VCMFNTASVSVPMLDTLLCSLRRVARRRRQIGQLAPGLMALAQARASAVDVFKTIDRVSAACLLAQHSAVLALSGDNGCCHCDSCHCYAMRPACVRFYCHAVSAYFSI
jgi:hypothetical protein